MRANQGHGGGGDDVSEELSEAELAEKRRYVASRAARDHWSASELAHVDDMARWLATLDAANERCAAAEARVRELEEFRKVLEDWASTFATDPES
jgi:hypothetical protein